MLERQCKSADVVHILSLQGVGSFIPRGQVGTGYPHVREIANVALKVSYTWQPFFIFLFWWIWSGHPFQKSCLFELFVWLRNYMNSPVWWEIDVLEMWVFFHLVQLDEIPFLQIFVVLFFPFHHMLLHLIFPHLWKEGLTTIWFFDILNFLAAC